MDDSRPKVLMPTSESSKFPAILKSHQLEDQDGILCLSLNPGHIPRMRKPSKGTASEGFPLPSSGYFFMTSSQKEWQTEDNTLAETACKCGQVLALLKGRGPEVS
jgi:hypothetical protein